MHLNSTWATPEPPDALWFEQVNNAAVYIGAIAYGILIIVFFLTAESLIREKSRKNRPWLLFIFVLFALGTVNICMNVYFNELAWIDERGYPGGPLAFLMEQQSMPINTAGTAAGVIIACMTDALLLWRCYRVWGNWYIMVVPTLMWVAATVLGVFTTLQAAQPDSSLWANNTMVVSVPYWSLSVALSLLLTMLLIARLIYIRHKLVLILGPQHGKVYSGLAVMILESSLPYGLVSLIFIILYGMNNVAEILFIPLMAQVECIVPMVIILRVSRGRALDNEHLSAERLSHGKFRPAFPSGETSNYSDATFKGASATRIGDGQVQVDVSIDKV